MLRFWRQVVLAFSLACGSIAAAQDAAPSDSTPPNAASSGASDYVIGPGDQLQVFVWRNPELSVTVTVRPDGKMSMPLVENMEAVGKSPSQLAHEIAAVLSEFVRDPKVNVIVDKAVSTLSQVKIVGQVKNPQAIPYREGLKVLDVVLASGGLTDFAAPNRSQIVREVNGKKQEIRVKLGKLMTDGDLTQNFDLRPGDVFIVPQSRF